MSDATWDAAGTTLTGMGDDGVEWIVTYGLPVAGTALGIGLVVGLTVKYGKRVKGWLS